MLWGTWALSSCHGNGNTGDTDANSIFKENEDPVTVLRTMKRKQSKVTVMFGVNPYLFGCLAFKTPF